MDVVARITYIGVGGKEKLTSYFLLRKVKEKYWWFFITNSRTLTPNYNFFLREKSYIIECYEPGSINLFLGLPFEEWHLSKWATRYNGCNRKDKR